MRYHLMGGEGMGDEEQDAWRMGKRGHEDGKMRARRIADAEEERERRRAKYWFILWSVVSENGRVWEYFKIRSMFKNWVRAPLCRLNQPNIFYGKTVRQPCRVPAGREAQVRAEAPKKGSRWKSWESNWKRPCQGWCPGLRAQEKVMMGNVESFSNANWGPKGRGGAAETAFTGLEKEEKIASDVHIKNQNSW